MFEEQGEEPSYTEYNIEEIEVDEPKEFGVDWKQLQGITSGHTPGGGTVIGLGMAAQRGMKTQREIAQETLRGIVSDFNIPQGTQNELIEMLENRPYLELENLEILAYAGLWMIGEEELTKNNFNKFLKKRFENRTTRRGGGKKKLPESVDYADLLRYIRLLSSPT
jgi:hypothetical protein